MLMPFPCGLHEGQLHGSQEPRGERCDKEVQVVGKVCLKQGQEGENKTSYGSLGSSGKWHT